MRASGAWAGACLALIVIVTATQVFCRYVLGAPLRWPEELSRLLFVWLTYGGCLLLPALRQQISIEFLHDLLSPPVKAMVDLLIDLLAIAFFVYLAFSGYHVMQAMAGIRLPALQYPVNLMFGLLTVAAVAQAYLHLESAVGNALKLAGVRARPRSGSDL